MSAEPSNPGSTAIPSVTTRLTPEAAAAIGRATNATVGLLAVCAAILSYNGLHRLAAGPGGVPGALSYLLPVVVDGLVVVGSLSTVYAALAGLSGRWPWALVGMGVVTSVAGNIAAADATVVARFVAATPPVVLALALETAVRLGRHRAGLPAPARVRSRRTVPAATAATVSLTPAPTPTPPPGGPAGRGSTRERVASILAENPAMSASAIGRELGIDPSYARRLVRETQGADTDTSMATGRVLRLAANEA